jgi:ribosomal protein L30E
MDTNEIKKMLKSENLVMGSDEVLKLLRANQLESAYLARNAPKAVTEDVKRYAELNNASFEVLDVPNDELGILCKKPFNVAAIGIKKAAHAPKKRH